MLTINSILVEPKFKPILPSDPFCLLSPAKMMLVTFDGEEETRIHDERRSNELLIDYDNRKYQSVTLYDGSISLLRIQLHCSQESNVNSLKKDCSHAHYINVWIDFNDDGKFDDSENRVNVRSPNNGNLPSGTYDLQISIPLVDHHQIKAGSHRMRVQVIPSETYTKKCGVSDYSEIREYTVNIIQKDASAGNYCYQIYCSD